jgi:hypothetical protein
VVDLDHPYHLRCLYFCFEVVSGLKIKINFSKSNLVPVGVVGDFDGLACILDCWVSFFFAYEVFGSFKLLIKKIKYLGSLLGASYKAQ